MTNGLDEQYIDLLKDILENGTKKDTRNGQTLSVFGRTIRYKFNNGKFPLLTTKKMHWKSIVTELIWFLRGETNIKYLVDNGVHIWDGDCYRSYLRKCGELKNNTESPNDLYWDLSVPKEPKIRPFTKEEFVNKIKTDDEFANKWGELGPIYGKQWRDWGGRKTDGFIEYESNGYNENIKGVDQIVNLINELKTNPDSRRMIVNAWNVGELENMALPPCHYGFQIYTRELSIEEKEHQLEKTNCINNIENDRIVYGHDWEKYIQEQYEGIQSTQGIIIPTRAISLMWNQRSVDVGLGLPFNIASYGLLLEIIAKAVNMFPDELIGNLGDTHLYLNHVEPIKEQIGRELDLSERLKLFNEKMGYGDFFLPVLSSVLDFQGIPKNTREPFPLPTLSINTEFWPTESGECGVGPIDAIALFNSFDDDNFCKCLLEDDIQLSNYQSYPAIKLPLSN